MAVGRSEFGVDLAEGGEGTSRASGGITVRTSGIVADEATRALGALDSAGFREGTGRASDLTSNTDGTNQGLRFENSSLGAVVSSQASGTSGHSTCCPGTVGTGGENVLGRGRTGKTGRADRASSLSTDREGTNTAGNGRLQSEGAGRALVSNGADGTVGGAGIRVVALRAFNLNILVDGRAVVTSTARNTRCLRTSRSCTRFTPSSDTSEGVGERTGVSSGAASAVGGTTFSISTIETTDGEVVSVGASEARVAVVADGVTKGRPVSRLAGNGDSLVTTAHTSGAEVASGGTHPRIRALGTAERLTVGGRTHEARRADLADQTKAIGTSRARLEDGDTVSRSVARESRRAGNTRSGARIREEAVGSVTRNRI